ncbi:c-type cytochrome [Myxococcota bacterium]|nr:c-type cytochrome [Myxococcota bacterium]MBU1429103.1 c-type cytochrome [Myxococcota bacterium]MBU1899751.1 c-type cytochrome [Myxococcota bacterium]
MSLIAAAFFVAFTLALAVIVLRYRRRGPGDLAQSQVTCSPKAGGPLVLLALVWGLASLVCGTKAELGQRVAHYGGYIIKAQLNEGVWRFTYPDDQTVEARLYLPKGEKIQLIFSTDAPHSVLVPQLGVQRSLMPGRLETAWITPSEVGVYALACAGLCAHGVEGAVEIKDKAEFDALVEDRFGAVPPSPEEIGAELYVSLTCSTCHSTDGKPGVGPSFKGLFGQEAHPLEGGATVKADEDYIIESIKTPNAKLAKGFKPDQMPQIFGELKPEEYEALIAFIKSAR